MQRIAAIIVAAGSSSRLGRPKQLLVLDGEPLLQRAIRIAREAGAEPVFAVLGAHRDAIERSVNFAGAKIIVNQSWQEGIAGSIRVGVEALRLEMPGATGVLLMTCDQPRLATEHLRRMIEMFLDAPRGVTASVYAGTRGTPAIFPATAFDDLCALRGDKGARSLLANSRCTVQEIPLDGGEIDIDRPEDLAQLT